VPLSLRPALASGGYAASRMLAFERYGLPVIRNSARRISDLCWQFSALPVPYFAGLLAGSVLVIKFSSSTSSIGFL